MTDHPVVACYHGADSSGAVKLGARLAAAIHEPLLLVSAYDFEPVALTPGVIPTSFNDRRFDAAQAHVDRARQLVPEGLALREDVVPAEGVPDALADVAREADACLLTVGRDVEGHVARTLLERSPCPLAVAPSDIGVPADAPLRAIGVAWDGSPGARFALQMATHLAARTGAAVEVLQADSNPGQRLVEASAELDLLLCGSHGRGRVLGALLGSVSAHLLAAAQCPVLVVPLRVRSRETAPLGLTTAAG